MLRNLLKPFTALVTPFADKLVRDPFLKAQFKTAGLYFLFCLVTLLIVGGLVDYEVRSIFKEMLAHPGLLSPEEALAKVEAARIQARIFYVICFGIGAYALIGLALKPIKEATQAQRRFIANIAHELRAPLTAARMETEVALRDTKHLTAEELATLLQRHIKDIDHISRIIQFLLVLSDYEKQRSHEVFQRVRVATMVNAVIGRYQERIEDAGITLTVSVADSVCVLGNSTALEKVLANLIRNSLAHTARGGELSIQTSLEGNRVDIVIRDTGNGIPKAEQEQLFTPFFRASNAVPGGSGLGLAIVDEIVRMHKGHVTVDSDIGRGTAVTISLPRLV